MENSDKLLIEQTLKKLKVLTKFSDDKSSALSETIASNLKELPEIKKYINENNKDNESKIFFEMGKYLKYSRYKKCKFVKHSYDSDNYFYMLFSGNVAKIDIIYTKSYLTFKEYLKHLIKLKLLGENYIYKKCIRKNKKVFPFNENMDILSTNTINIDHYDELIKKIKKEIENSSWFTNTNEINEVSDFIDLYNPKISRNKYPFMSKENKYPALLPIYTFDKLLKPISFIGQLTQPKGIKLLSSYVCLSSCRIFYINKTEIDRHSNLYTLFRRKVSEDVINNIFEGHFLFQDTDINFLSKNYSKYFYVQNFIKGQNIIQQNTPNEGIFFINKGVFQLKSKRTYHELNELKFKVMQSLKSENKKKFTIIRKKSSEKYENIYEGLNPMQIEQLTKEREFKFNVYKSSDVIGLNDIYDIKTGLNNFSVECISEEGEAYFLPKEIITSMSTNLTIKANIDELVGKQCLLILREINRNKELIDEGIRSINTISKQKKYNKFYLRKNINDKYQNYNGLTQRNTNINFSSISYYNSMNTFNNNYSNTPTLNNKVNSLKNLNIKNNFNKMPIVNKTRILSTRLILDNKVTNSYLSLNTNENIKNNKIYSKIYEREDERNIKSPISKKINPILTYREKIKTFQILNEEKKNEIINTNGFYSPKSKFSSKKIIYNQNKISNIFNRKSGKKRIIKNIIIKESKNNSKSIKIIQSPITYKNQINSVRFSEL